MTSVASFAAIYVLGGLTFLPLLLGLFLCYEYLFRAPRFYLTGIKRSNAIIDSKSSCELGPSSSDPARSLDALKLHPQPSDVAAGYFAICREYVPGGTNGKPPERTTPAGAVVAVESPSVYQAMYRSIFDRSKGSNPSLDASQGRNRKSRNVFYVILR
jgi:hypothetical protein